MTANPKLKLTIQFTDPTLKAEVLNKKAQLLIDELKDIKDVDEIDVHRVIDPTPAPEGSKAIGTCLVGLLTAVITIDNAIKVLGFLIQQLLKQWDNQGKKKNKGMIIEITIEVDGEKYIVKVSSREELDYAFQAIEKFIAAKASKKFVAA
jgi:hypothetical protein